MSSYTSSNSFIFCGKNRQKLPSKYYANVLMLYLEGGKKEASGFFVAFVTKQSNGKGCFCSGFVHSDGCTSL